MTDDSVRVARLDRVPLAVVRLEARPAELPRVVTDGCGRVWNALRAQGIRGGRHVAIFWDSAIHLDVGVETSSTFDEQDDIVRSATPAGLVASVTHFGPYGHLGAAHEAVHAWCRANGRQPAGPRWEIYGHWRPEWDADPSQIRTDVFYLLA